MLYVFNLQIHKWSPEKAVEYIQEKRPHIWLRDKQMDSIQEFWKACNNDIPSGA